MATKQYYFTLKGAWQRFVQEMKYSNPANWSLADVGRFWDSVEDYDDINEEIYPYFRRFTNSFELAARYLSRTDYSLLDLQARSGKGSLFWHEKGKIKHATCVDFSDYLTSLADKRLSKSSLNYRSLKVLNFPLPFPDKTFDFICSYETIEHVPDYKMFIQELKRALTDDGIMILTCPNRSWEWVHWLTVIININHSEGPHRFLPRKNILKCLDDNHLDVLRENTTILLPFNNKYSVLLDKFLEKLLPEAIKRYLALRRTFIVRKK